jgi:hypothetical protein
MLGRRSMRLELRSHLAGGHQAEPTEPTRTGDGDRQL